MHDEHIVKGLHDFDSDDGVGPQPFCDACWAPLTGVPYDSTAPESVSFISLVTGKGTQRPRKSELEYYYGLVAPWADPDRRFQDDAYFVNMEILQNGLRAREFTDMVNGTLETAHGPRPAAAPIAAVRWTPRYGSMPEMFRSMDPELQSRLLSLYSHSPEVVWRMWNDGQAKAQAGTGVNLSVSRVQLDSYLSDRLDELAAAE